jgi:hypothetical protein
MINTTRIILLICLGGAFFNSYVDKMLIPKIQVSIGIILVSLPAYLIKGLLGSNHFLIIEGANHIYLSKAGIIVFYGGLLVLSHLVSILIQLCKK